MSIKARSRLNIALVCTTSIFAWAAAAQAQTKDGENAETVVVTGSRVIADAANSPTPLTVVTSAQLLATTPTMISDGLDKLPEFQSGGGRTTPANAGSADGASNVLNLRGLGANRTLVLQDGRRLVASNADGTTDVDTLPQMLIQRVDVVTGGASAIYGSDAVSGVVNFIIDHNFTGWKFDANAGISTYSDASSYNFGVAAGSSLFGGRGHIEGTVHVFHQDPVYDNQRPINNMIWGQVGGGTAANPYQVVSNLNLVNFSYTGKVSCTGCAANGQQFISNGVLGPFNPGTPSGLAGINIGGDGAVSNFHTFLSLTQNENSFGRFSYDINDDTVFYVEASASELYSKSQFNNIYFQNGNAASSYFANNPFLPAATQAQLANPSGQFQMVEYLDNPNLGPWATQITQLNELNFTTTMGVDGVVFGHYNWSAYYTHGNDHLEIGSPHNLSLQRQWAANDAVATPGGGIACYVSTTTYASLYPGCTPINPFGRTSLTANQFNYIINKTYTYEDKVQDNIGGSIAGPLFDDWAGPVNAALSAEARWYGLSFDSNASSSNVDCTGLRLCNTLSLMYQGVVVNPLPQVNENVWETALEVGIPLLKDVPLVQSLSLDLAGRYTDYSATGSVETWKAGFDYHVNDEVRFRGTTSIDIRAPTLFDLYAPATYTNAGYSDIHTQTGGIDRVLSQGNPQLVPEVGRTYTGGVVFTPDFVPNLTFSVDYYHIGMKNAISSVTGNSTAVENLCEAAGGAGPFCALYVRPLPFSNTTSLNYPTQIISENINASFVRTEGWDIEANYAFELGDVWADAPGTVQLRLVANYVPLLESQQIPGAPTYYSNVGAQPGSKFKNNIFVNYNLGSWAFNLQDRYLAGFNNTPYAGAFLAPNYQHVNSVNYQDITIDKKFLIDGQTLDGYFSVQNVANVLPPINLANTGSSPGTWYQGIGNAASNSGGPLNIYDPIGRYFTLGIKATL